MIKKQTRSFSLLQVHQNYLQTIKTNGSFTGKEWDKLKGDQSMKDLKLYIRTELETIQLGRCAYCGNEYDVTGDSQIEHIAAKASNRHPEFMFTEDNLVLACQSCNGFKKKGNKQTIKSKQPVYKSCTFSIVHPYYDDPSAHYAWTNGNKKVLISHKTPEGLASIKMFKLDEEKQSIARAKDCLYAAVPVTLQQGLLIDYVLHYSSF